MSMTKADFYFGAFLTQVVNSNFAPTLVAGGEKRRIYHLSTNSSNFKVYAKYVAKPRVVGDFQTWDFPFSAEEITAIHTDQSINMFAFVCAKNNLAHSEIAILNREQFLICIGEDFVSPNRRVSIKAKKHARNFTVYGTGIDVIQNPILIIRNVERRMTDFKKRIVGVVG